MFKLDENAKFYIRIGVSIILVASIISSNVCDTSVLAFVSGLLIPTQQIKQIFIKELLT